MIFLLPRHPNVLQSMKKSSFTVFYSPFLHLPSSSKLIKILSDPSPWTENKICPSPSETCSPSSQPFRVLFREREKTGVKVCLQSERALAKCCVNKTTQEGNFLHLPRTFLPSFPLLSSPSQSPFSLFIAGILSNLKFLSLYLIQNQFLMESMRALRHNCSLLVNL